jgi:hypothetical protein
MPLKATQTWFATWNPLKKNILVDGNLCFRNYSVAYDTIIASIKATVTGACGTATNSDMSTRVDEGTLKKDATVGSWDELAQLVIYEFKSEGNYLSELALAEVVMGSPLIEAAYNKALRSLHECIDQFGVMLLLLAKKEPSNAAIMTFRQEMRKMYYTTEFKIAYKHYRGFFPGNAGMSLKEAAELDVSQLELSQKIALVHDMLQVVWDFYKAWIEEGFPIDDWPSKFMKSSFLSNEVSLLHPLSKPTKAQTGEQTKNIIIKTWVEPVMEDRKLPGVDERAKQFAKSKGRPSEAGPSFTTVRFCSINDSIQAFKHISRSLMTKNNDAIAELTKQEITHLVWGIFGFWSLHYRKSVGPAHCYFEIQEAAKQCGFPLSASEGYPDASALKVTLKSTSAPGTASRLRQKALKFGLEQSIIKNDSEMTSTTLRKLNDPKERDLSNVSVRKTLPNPL